MEKPRMAPLPHFSLLDSDIFMTRFPGFAKLSRMKTKRRRTRRDRPDTRGLHAVSEGDASVRFGPQDLPEDLLDLRRTHRALG